MKTLKTALVASIPSTIFALAIAIALSGAKAVDGTERLWEIAIAMEIGVAMAPWPGLAVLASFRGWPAAYNIQLPPPRQETRIVAITAVVTGLVVLAYAFLAIAGAQLALRVIVATIALGLAVAAASRLAMKFHRARRYRPILRRAIENFTPQYILYMGRRDGGAYQIKQWLPQILAITPRVIIVVRDPEAAKHLATSISSEIPIISCRENKDLDDVMPSSVRAVFYVNSVTNNANMVSYRNVKHVYLGHGDSDKEISAHPAHRMYDAIFVAGQAAIDRYATENVNLDPGQAHIIGRPQLQRVNVPEFRSTPQTVLYAPTWSGYNQATSLSSLSIAVPFIADLLARGITVLFRPHPFSRFSSKDQDDIAEIDNLLVDKKLSHLGSEDTASMELLDLFNASDALVTDVSSVLVDYLASHKPAAVLLPAHCRATNGRDSDIGTKFPSVQHAYLPTSPDSASWHLFLGPDPMRSTRDEAAAYYLGGTSPDAFREAVLSLPASST
ncbi:CDP-glycerol glycerophosphotransferase family protein [Arthrobacter rhombi]|uniref:Putative integral membrane protein n=1 Tax=Arthrobacter rhombi TaxID=71253 RepID=A0A1R4GCE1_9MICC|nr:CDP-glycerol glycerophosphotransferase family protein [Arthrobacter rhombi]SJM65632.1 putative integral membrane protein [Arthrobacter rhombi]